MTEPKRGQVWKFSDSDHLYVITEIDIGGLRYYFPINISTGGAGPLCSTETEAAESLVFVTSNISDLLKKRKRK